MKREKKSKYEVRGVNGERGLTDICTGMGSSAGLRNDLKTNSEYGSDEGVCSGRPPGDRVRPLGVKYKISTSELVTGRVKISTEILRGTDSRGESKKYIVRVINVFRRNRFDLEIFANILASHV